MGGALGLRRPFEYIWCSASGLRDSRNSRCWSGVPPIHGDIVNQAHLIPKKKSSDFVSPRTINCFSAKSLPFEALFSIGTHIAFFSPSLLPGLPRAFVPVKPTPLSKVEGRDWVPTIAQIETPEIVNMLSPCTRG